METQKDPLTGEIFTPRKISQRFAKPANRIVFNNLKATKIRREKSYVDKPLHVNNRILKELLPEKGEIILHKEFLLGKGFRFTVHTHFKSIGNEHYYAVYDYVFCVLPNDQIKIIKK